MLGLLHRFHCEIAVKYSLHLPKNDVVLGYLVQVRNAVQIGIATI